MPKELLREKMDDSLMLATIRDMQRVQHAAHNPKLKKDGVIQTSPVVIRKD